MIARWLTNDGPPRVYPDTFDSNGIDVTMTWRAEGGCTLIAHAKVIHTIAPAFIGEPTKYVYELVELELKTPQQNAL